MTKSEEGSPLVGGVIVLTDVVDSGLSGIEDTACSRWNGKDAATLPAEIRNLIYRLTLKSTSVQIMIGVHYYSNPPGAALLSTCRTVHLETAPVLYGSNIFQFCKPTTAIKWMNDIGTINCGCLRDLRVFVDPVFVQEHAWGHMIGQGMFGRVSVDTWAELLRKLGRETIGLMSMHVYFDEEGMHRSLGRDETFMQALAEVRRLKNLENFEIEGVFSKNLLG
ncbi:hypothetical protein MMC21_006748 [Puttea exsequens]|nr:hypothetical protein [Puttea exsequens]